jgi:hypothetical protein
MYTGWEDPIGSADQKDFSVSDILSYKYAGVVCAVECTLSQYKSLFLDNQHIFMLQNLKMTFLVHSRNPSLSVSSTFCQNLM